MDSASSQYISAVSENRGGFSFDNVKRNKQMVANGVIRPFTTMKTGTTICGVVCASCVVLGADTRATTGPIVADKNCNKLHYMAENIYCAGAGTAADLEHTTKKIRSQMELHRLATEAQPRVGTCVKRLSDYLFQYQGYVGCALVLGGVDVKGPQLYQIYPHGSTDSLPFAAMGSGSLAAMSVLETGYKDNMTADEGVELVKKAITAGVMNDLGSGGNVDCVIITKDNSPKHIRPAARPTPRTFRNPAGYKFPIGTTPVVTSVTKTILKDGEFVAIDADGDQEMVVVSTT
ncbi:proteasome subunit, beta type, 7, putative [Perkinsus marinus ATCC 50983]|uniref:Proteasome subunit beta n=1 Tax=Perkinsus marinus (strain ATCC 50983 / TXsc) TaxID=423536 RepID=C5LDW7_PERM5|nr:proteasome subunit, beta type, 7, putative [Perkinsus marinus ATCC 50983]EER05131.1 proteasome subunit, beta type, 7, putative [Perkinsus marinus ATCC 50983]|eukprot:XP_002773315.1 proteasome subunit, beta type, 7, putative [Perkinsus marinus ATCC 50983]